MIKQFLVRKLAKKTDDLTFWEHAEVLRKYLFRIVIFILLTTIVAFFFKSYLFDVIILGPKQSDFITYRLLCSLGKQWNMDGLCFSHIPFSLINIDLAGQFRWHIIISFVAGLILSFPFIIWQLWLFIKPALKQAEQKYSRGLLFYILGLFFIGVLFGYYVIMPLTLNFLVNYELSTEIKNQITISSYISTTTVLPLSTGIVFELPVLVYFLAKIGMLTALFLRKYRKHSIVIILLIAGIITPSTDMFSQILVALPLYLLYEISIWIAQSVNKKQKLAG
ncbi:MAG: twin-arginine translocase subunit TatC [Bacteroidota bacterium]